MLLLSVYAGGAVGAEAAKRDTGADATIPVPPPGHVAGAASPRADAAWLPGVLSDGPLGPLGVSYAPNIQSETSIAVADSIVVLGFNDFRGFDLSPVSIVGTAWSHDGGLTFTDGGPLPAPAGSCVCGDAVVAVHHPAVGPPVFYVSSVYLPPGGGVSLSIHRSNDGVTWEGPFEVTSATSTTDRLEDKEWCAVDPETGRLFVSWTRITSSGATEMRTTYSDDLGETWSTSKLLGTSGQGTVIAPDPGGSNVYVAWRSRPSTGNEAVRFVRSTDNGDAWNASVNLTPTFKQVLPPYGFDRYNSFPSMAVNPSDGGVELVWAASEDGTPAKDFGDIFYRRSVDAGAHWSTPVKLNPLAGTDRAQVFPTVSVAGDGRIDVFWYDESAGSGVSDLTEIFYTFSSDLGGTWSSPVPVTPRPFHNEAGNNYGAPHQGDYIDAVSVAAAYGGVTGFGDPSPLATWPDGMAAIVMAPVETASLRVRPGSESVADFGCGADDGVLTAGESAQLALPLENFGRAALAGIGATLTALTPGVSVPGAARTYPSIAPGASAGPAAPFIVGLDPAYACGTPARFRLDVSADGVAPAVVEFELPTGVVTSETVLLSEDFDGVTAPDLPSGWSTGSVCPSCAANDWVTATTTPESSPNAAFADDVNFTSFTRLSGPEVAVPANADYLEIEFDVRYDLEFEDARTGYDGASFSYLLDGVNPTLLGTAHAVEFDNRYAHWIVRASGDGRGDRSGWSGDSGGWRTARFRIPDMAGHTLTPQFDLTTDGDTGGGGVWVDDVVVKALEVGCGPCTPLAVAPPAASGLRLAATNPFRDAASVRYTLPGPARVRLEVFDPAGRRVRTLEDGVREAGDHRAALRRGTGGDRLPSGVYLVRLAAGALTRTIRVVALD